MGELHQSDVLSLQHGEGVEGKDLPPTAIKKKGGVITMVYMVRRGGGRAGVRPALKAANWLCQEKRKEENPSEEYFDELEKADRKGRRRYYFPVRKATDFTSSLLQAGKEGEEKENNINTSK